MIVPDLFLSVPQLFHARPKGVSATSHVAAPGPKPISSTLNSHLCLRPVGNRQERLYNPYQTG